MYWIFISCLQYWGWCKHRYSQVFKKTFSDAKRVACECLDSCPVDVIRWFFDRSWRFMDAYQHGLTGKAAEWAVRKQKSHRRVGSGATMSIAAVMNQNWSQTYPKGVYNFQKLASKIVQTQKSMGETRKGCFWMYFAPLSMNLKSICHEKILLRL